MSSNNYVIYVNMEIVEESFESAKSVFEKLEELLSDDMVFNDDTDSLGIRMEVNK